MMNETREQGAINSAAITESPYGALLPQYRIDGFDPNNALTKILDVDENGQPKASLFMKAQPATAWFLTVFPNGCMNHTFNILNERKATVTVSLYRDVNDPRPAATATCTRYFSEDEHGRFYDQNAVTAAFRKALSYLCLGTPVDAHEVEGLPVEDGSAVPERCDGGVPVALTDVPRPTAGVVKSVVENEADAVKPEKAARKRKKDAATSEPAQTIEPASVLTEPEPAQPPQPPAKVEKIPETLEEALAVIIPRGVMEGKTIAQAAEERGNDFIRFWYDKARSSMPGSPFAVATGIFCEYNGC